jgi:hypothetical protein
VILEALRPSQKNVDVAQSSVNLTSVVSIDILILTSKLNSDISDNVVVGVQCLITVILVYTQLHGKALLPSLIDNLKIYWLIAIGP